jgi:hypothetical protein
MRQQKGRRARPGLEELETRLTPDAVVGQADLAGRRRAAAADHAGVADGMVWRPERPRRQQRLARRQPAHGAVDARRLQALRRRQRRQDGRQPRASIDLPVPGLPSISTLWPPLAATTRARLALSWPRASAKSTS